MHDFDLEAVETAARLGLAARALEQRLNADTSDYAGPQLACACGQAARYIDRRAKSFMSVLGAIRLERAYYHCQVCGHGFCPRDQALGLESSSVTPGVLRMTASAAALVSFEESSGLLHELAGVEVSAKQVERVAEALGTRLKRAGMHWTVQGANAIIALRCSKLSGRFEDFWERRSDRMKAAA